jgi:hypothetical protein
MEEAAVQGAFAGMVPTPVSALVIVEEKAAIHPCDPGFKTIPEKIRPQRFDESSSKSRVPLTPGCKVLPDGPPQLFYGEFLLFKEWPKNTSEDDSVWAVRGRAMPTV